MPNIKSAKKRVLVNKTKHDKTAIKKANAAVENNAADKDAAVKSAQAKIDRAVAKGLIHKNNAAHKKSELALKLNKSNNA